MATVNIVKRKREKGIRYQVYYKDPYSGKKKYYKTFQRQKDAQQSANDLRTLLDSGKLPDQNHRIRMMTFGEVAEELREDWTSKLKTATLRKKTVEDYLITLNTVEKVFGTQLLMEVTSGQIKSYRDEVASDLSNISSNKRLAVIKKVFAKGIELNAVIVDPTEKLKKLSEADHERNRYLKPKELFTLVGAAEKTKAKNYLPALIYLGAEHGASKQEALSLRWSDIDFDFKERGTIRFYRTKNRKERTDYLMPNSKLALLHLKEHQENTRRKKGLNGIDSDLVFSHMDGSAIICFNKAWWAALEAAGIKDFHYHDLRHTFCSNLIIAGAGIKEVKEMIGHKDISMTDRYSHLSMDHKLMKQNQLSDHYTAQAATSTE